MKKIKKVVIKISDMINSNGSKEYVERRLIQEDFDLDAPFNHERNLENGDHIYTQEEEVFEDAKSNNEEV